MTPNLQEETNKSPTPPKHSVHVTMEDIPLDDLMAEVEEPTTAADISPLAEQPPKESEKKGHKRHSSRIGSIYRKKGTDIQTVASAHDGDGIDTAEPLTSEQEDASWGDVCRACCCHSRTEWCRISIFLFFLLACLYFFLFGLDLLGTSFRVVGGCTAASLLGSDTNPLASVMIGIIATALLQSSSTTTSIIVSLVSGGLDVQQVRVLESTNCPCRHLYSHEHSHFLIDNNYRVFTWSWVQTLEHPSLPCSSR